MQRRHFIQQTSLVSFGFMGLQSFLSACGDTKSKLPLHPGYGPLSEDSEGILKLPPDFQYKVISRMGNPMGDGFLVPGLADGMACFQGPGKLVIVIRNHEVTPSYREGGPFMSDLSLLNKVNPSQLYDYGNGKYPCLGGTTTFIYNPDGQQVVTEYLSLAGTIRNCAGGTTPWNSWITCEEDVSNSDENLEKNHGYNFEVPAQVKPQLFEPVPLVGMGRFNHEAVCVHPETGIVYQTEDRSDGLIYRFLPNEKGNLRAGGRLQALMINDAPSFDTRNWREENMIVGQAYQVSWLDLENIDSPDDDLRERGFEKGAARFARGEGMWYGDGEAYFACTNGGQKRHGQIFRYRPSIHEGTPEEMDAPGVLDIFVEPNDSRLVQSCDNLTIASNGDLIICEDRATPRIVGVTPQGDIYHFAENIGYKSELAGACFSPDGNTMFVNIQGPGLTLAITGPWGNRIKQG